MRQFNIILGLVLVTMTGINCGGAEPEVVGDDDDDKDPFDDVVTETAHTGDVFNGLIDPVAVGFEFDGVLLNDGTLQGYVIGGEYQDGLVVMTLADEAFFSASDTATQDLHSCVALGTWEPAPRNSDLPNINNVDLWHSFEDAYFIDIGHNCINVQEKWGFEAETLLNYFNGMRLGIGFGPWTDYLKDQWSEESIDLHEDDFFAAYIALNDPNGTFDGDDWTSGLLFEWDEDSGELVADDEDLLIALPVVQIPPGGVLPQGYVRNFAYWYQDFPLMDFDGLKDGA